MMMNMRRRICSSKRICFWKISSDFSWRGTQILMCWQDGIEYQIVYWIHLRKCIILVFLNSMNIGLVTLKNRQWRIRMNMSKYHVSHGECLDLVRLVLQYLIIMLTWLLVFIFDADYKLGTLNHLKVIYIPKTLTTGLKLDKNVWSWR